MLALDHLFQQIGSIPGFWPRRESAVRSAPTFSIAYRRGAALSDSQHELMQRRYLFILI
jgi:hypothetical protein